MNTYVRKVDGACVDKHVSYPALACVTILAALYESASDAITALTDADSRINAELTKQPCMQSAIRSFIAGERLQKACDSAGVKLSDVEDLLRNSYREFLKEHIPNRNQGDAINPSPGIRDKSQLE